MNDLLPLLEALRAAQRGDLSVRLPIRGDPDLVQVAVAFNELIATQQALVGELTRVAREVGDEGRLGAQAHLPEAQGEWRALTEQMNAFARHITEQVRDFSAVTTAVARGDLSRKLTVPAQGEVLEVKTTINTMVDKLKTFAEEVARVSSQVGEQVQGSRPPGLEGVAGIWKDLADNVTLAEHLAVISRYKSEFLANMSHELRTPLNSLLILSKLLSDNREANLSAQQLEYAQTIHGSGSDLLSLVNDILDLSKVEAGKLKVEAREVRISDLQRFVERLFQPVADQKGLQLTVLVHPDTPERIHTDPLRLQQILKNLLANALKFTERGSVRLEVSATAGRVLFRVQDTGIGIRPEKQRLIFEAFQQEDSSTFQRYGGTGLGLSISREIAALLGGEISLESVPGEGSTFTLALPAGAGAPRAPVAAESCVSAGESPLRDPSLSGRRVLVVDDDVRNIFVFAGLLETQEIEVLYAENAAQGLELLDRHDVDLVLMDVMMPLMDGYQAMDAIRRHPRHAAVPIVAVTAKAQLHDRARCLAAGASDYLPIPVDAEQLLAVIKRLTPARTS